LSFRPRRLLEAVEADLRVKVWLLRKTSFFTAQLQNLLFPFHLKSERWLRGLGRMLPNLKEARSKPRRGRSFSLSLTLIKWDPVVAAG